MAPPVIATHEAPPPAEEPTHTVHTPVTQEPHVPTEPKTTEVQAPKVIPPTTARSTEPVVGGTPPGAVIPSTQLAERHGSGTSFGPNDGSPPEVSTPVRKVAHVAPPLKGVDAPPGELYIPMGGRIVLNITIIGIFPFTAVGLDYVTVGNFTGGAWIPPDGWVGPPPDWWTPPPPPQVWQDVTVWAVNIDTSVQVNTVTVVGHDDSLPVGQQDTLMLDDSTLAWGQVQDGRDGGAVQIAKVQTMPGVGPMCDAGQWMNTAMESSTHQGGITRLEWVMGAGLSVTSLVGGGATWWIRRLRGAHL